MAAIEEAEEAAGQFMTPSQEMESAFTRWNL
jgi:hypothetical protein